MIKSLDKMVGKVLSLKRRYRIAVAWAQDPNTLLAMQNAVRSGFAEAIMIGKTKEVKTVCKSLSINTESFEFVEAENETKASKEAVKLANSSQADIVMKGLVGTDKFLKAVMDKENGMMFPGATLTYVCAIEIPAYHKLLFITDPAVIPFPDLNQKVAMAEYAIEMSNAFGIKKPKVALIGASEKMSRHFENSVDYAVMCKMADRQQIKNCIMDGPLDIFLACDKKSGLIRGTTKPVVVMSRSESEKSKYYCIALACLMA